MSKNTPVLIPMDVALDLVAPYDLDEVLSSLKETGAIEYYFYGENNITVMPSSKKRFDIALLVMESIEDSLTHASRKSPH